MFNKKWDKKSRKLEGNFKKEEEDRKSIPVDGQTWWRGATFIVYEVLNVY